MRQRYYNTDIKHFINQDILEGNVISSQSLNRYAYVEGNPVNYNDPFGLSPRQILQPYVNLGHDILSMASMIPGPVGAIADICDIGLSYATGDFSALQLVDFMFSGGSPLDYAHVLCNFFQGLAGLAGGVGFTLGAAVGMTRQCFVAGTKVKTDDGDKNIEEIEEGDIVWAYDPVIGETGLKEVKQTFENETETLVHVTVSNENVKETIDTTVRHPFYVVGYGFRYASELCIGDKVRSVSGDIYEVTSVQIEQLDEPVKIYNFEVEDWHTYFVSESGILVHNTGCGTGTASTANKEGEDSSNSTAEGTVGSNTKNKRWKVGDPINQTTAAGNYPSWSTAKKRFWKNEAYYNASDYSEADLVRMRKGNAPLHPQYEVPMELYHKNGRRIN